MSIPVMNHIVFSKKRKAHDSNGEGYGTVVWYTVDKGTWLALERSINVLCTVL